MGLLQDPGDSSVSKPGLYDKPHSRWVLLDEISPMRSPNPDGLCMTLMIMVDGPAGCILVSHFYRLDLSFDGGNTKREKSVNVFSFRPLRKQRLIERM